MAIISKEDAQRHLEMWLEAEAADRKSTRLNSSHRT